MGVAEGVNVEDVNVGGGEEEVLNELETVRLLLYAVMRLEDLHW